MSLRELKLFPPILPPDEPGPDLGRPGSRRRLVLLAAALTTLTEIAVLAEVTPSIEMGGIGVSMSVIPALALGVACGDRLLGRSSLRRVAQWFWVATTGVIAALLVLYAVDGRVDMYCALVASALGEELVYRLAVPAVLAVLLQFGGVGSVRARLAGLALAGAWFVVLPGHQDQYDAAGPLPFMAYALLSAALVYRSGSVLPMAMAHAIVNLVTFLVWDDAIPADARAVSVAALLALLALGYGMPRRITLDSSRGMVDTVTGLEVVQLDEPEDGPVRAQLSDGRSFTLGRRNRR